MKATLIYTEFVEHPQFINFKRICEETLANLGYSVEETNLSDQNFFPFLLMSDYPDTNSRSISEAQLKAYPDLYSQDILSQMNKIKESEIVVFFTHMKHCIFSPMFLGWTQRVFPLKFGVLSQDGVLYNKKILFFLYLDQNDQISEATEIAIPFLKHNFVGMRLACYNPFIFSDFDYINHVMSSITDLNSLGLLA